MVVGGVGVAVHTAATAATTAVIAASQLVQC
jgi:hypothetical protein